MNPQELLAQEPVTTLFRAYGDLADNQETLAEAQRIASTLTQRDYQTLVQAWRIQQKLGAESLRSAQLLCQVGMGAIRQAV